MNQTLDAIIPPADLFGAACDAQDGIPEAFERVMRYASECARLGFVIPDQIALIAAQVLLDAKPKRGRGRPRSKAPQSSLQELGELITAGEYKAVGLSQSPLAAGESVFHRLAEDQGYEGDDDVQRQAEALHRSHTRRLRAGRKPKN